MSQDIEGTRDLRKLIPRSTVYWHSNPDDTTATNGWEILGAPTEQFVVYRTYVDIVGWSKDDVTAFTQGAAFQEGCPIFLTPGGATSLKCWEMVTVNRISDSAFTNPQTLHQGVGWCPPGLGDSEYNLEEVLAGRWREIMTDTNLSLARLISQGTWGCGDATAADRIHITKAFYLDSAVATGGKLVIPNGAVVIPTLLVKESALVYLERLRRSYVLADNR